MKLFVDAAGRTFEIEIQKVSNGGAFMVRVNGRERTVDYAEVSPHEVSLLLDGRSRTLWIEECNGAYRMSDGEGDLLVRVENERAYLAESILGRRAHAGHGREVRAVMPGFVTRVLVREGDLVEPGTPLVVVETMKMENEVRAEQPGVVRNVRVQAGSTVNAGELLVEIGPPVA